MYKINSHPDRVSVPDEAVKAGGRGRLWFRKTKDPNVSTTAPSCWAEDGKAGRLGKSPGDWHLPVIAGRGTYGLEVWFGFPVPSDSPRPEQLSVNVAREVVVGPILGVGSPAPYGERSIARGTQLPLPAATLLPVAIILKVE